MENKNKKYSSIAGFRKFFITIIAFGLIMLAGHIMIPASVSPVIWGIVSSLGLFLTGSVVKGINNKPRYGDKEDDY